MIHKGSVIARMLLGGLILILGLVLILDKNRVWSLFEIFYAMLGIQAQQSRFWGMFVSTIGLALFALGVFVMWVAWRRWRGDQA